MTQVEIGKDGDRREVISKYREYILGNQDLLNTVKDLRGGDTGMLVFA